MADTLVNSEILGIWNRIKKYIDLNTITAVDQSNQKDQLKRAMQDPKIKSDQFKQNMDTLVDKGFSSAFVENEDARGDLLAGKILEFEIKGTPRFRIAKGIPTFQTREGKTIRAGQFLKGTDIETALRDLKEKGAD